MPTPDEFLVSANHLLEDLVSLRRKLHRIPEFALDLPQTQQALLSELEGLGEITLGKSLSSIVLVIRGGSPGPTVLLRADMDALHVKEETNLDFASVNGYMHACGHDLHMSAGVGAAKLLHEHKRAATRRCCNLVPARRGGSPRRGCDDRRGHAGNYRKSASGRIRPSCISPRCLAGTIACKPGAMMASAGDMNVVFRGSGGHGSMPWLSKDPVAPMVEAISSLQTMLNKNFDQFDPVILNVSWIRAGDDATNNVIPDTASFGATVRTFSAVNTEKLHSLAPKLINSIAEGFGVTATIEFSEPTKVLINDEDSVERVSKIAQELVGSAGYMKMDSPIAGGEDFASIVHEVPGAFVFLGACPKDIDHTTAPTNHSARAIFDDSVIPLGSALLASLASSHLL